MRNKSLKKYFFISFTFCFMAFSLHVDADITRQLQPPENRVLSSISHGQQFKAGDSIRYTGYETIDLCPSGGRSCSPQDWWTTETKNCYVTLGLSRSVTKFADYTFGSSFQGSLKRSGSMNNILTCSFDKNFSFPTNYVAGPAVAVVYVSYGTESFKDSFNLGPWGEHIFVAASNLPPTASFIQSFSNYNEDDIKDRSINKIKFEGRGVDPEGSIASWELFVNGTRVLSKSIFPPNSPIMSSPVYTLDTDDYPAGPMTVKFSVRDVLGLEASVSETVVLGNKITPINGSCGTNARTYLSTETSYTGTFCSAGKVSPDSPAFPSPGNTVSWQCQGSDGGNSPACGATRQAAPAPTLTFTADSTNISYNEATILRWTSTNTTSCTAPNAWLLSDTPPTPKSLNGNQSTGNLTSAKTYTLRCEGVAGGSIEGSVTVNVSAQPVLTLRDTDCSGQAIPSNLEIESSKTIAVCEGTTPVNPASWNINPVSQTAFNVAGSNIDQERTFTAIGDDEESITIQATKSGYISSSTVTLMVEKDPFLPPVPQKGEDQWKEIAP